MSEEPLCRPEQINAAERIILLGSRFVYVHGNTATGKSLTWQYVTQKYTEQESREDVKVCMIDCKFYSDAYELYAEVLKRLFPGSDIPARLTMLQFTQFVKNQIEDDSEIYYTLVFDNALALTNIDQKLFRMLPSLSHITGSRIGVVFISHIPWQSFKRELLVDFPQELRFPAYTEVEMKKILHQRFKEIYTSSMSNYANEDLPWDNEGQMFNVYRAVCDYVYQALQRSCNNISEIGFLVSAFFPAVVDAVFNGKVNAKSGKGLFEFCQQFLKFDLIKLYTRELSAIEYLQNRIDDTDDTTNNINSNILKVSLKDASYNTPQSDTKFFSKFNSRITSRGGRKSGKQADTLQLGPKQFTVERMFAIFYNIVDENVPFSIDINIQLATLISMGYLNRVSGSLDKSLTSGLKCKCNTNYQSTKQISESLNFPLDRYLHCLQ